MATYACADLHGSYPAFSALKSNLAPTDTCYILGDVIDRGPSGIQILDEILADPRFILLMGNHEDMLIQVANEYFSLSIEERKSFYLNYNYQSYIYNGGQRTFVNLMKSQFPRKKLSSIINLPLTLTYKSPSGNTILLSHAGYSYPRIPSSRYTLLWDRDHFIDSWTGNNSTYIIHGHTPVMYMEIPSTSHTMRPTPIYYADGHKINIDTGVCFTGILTILNLDTLTAKTIQVDPVVD